MYQNFTKRFTNVHFWLYLWNLIDKETKKCPSNSLLLTNGTLWLCVLYLWWWWVWPGDGVRVWRGSYGGSEKEPHSPPSCLKTSILVSLNYNCKHIKSHTYCTLQSIHIRAIVLRERSSVRGEEQMWQWTDGLTVAASLDPATWSLT